MTMMQGNIDILLISETKIDSTFLTTKFNIEGYLKPIRLDRTEHGGGVSCYSSVKIYHAKRLNRNNMEGMFIEINLRKGKWLLFASYNPQKANPSKFFEDVEKNLDRLLTIRPSSYWKISMSHQKRKYLLICLRSMA